MPQVTLDTNAGTTITASAAIVANDTKTGAVKSIDSKTTAAADAAKDMKTGAPKLGGSNTADGFTLVDTRDVLERANVTLNKYENNNPGQFPQQRTKENDDLKDAQTELLFTHADSVKVTKDTRKN